MTLPWFELLLFMAAICSLALYGLAFSGHFPSEFRNPRLRRGVGAAVFWGTLIAASTAMIIVLGFALRALPWPMTIIAAGAMLLAAPLLLRPLPDQFVDGPAGLLVFGVGGLVIAMCLWVVG